MALKTTSIHADETQLKRLDAWAKKLRRSRNSLINESIDDMLVRLTQENKQNGKVAATR